ncbi:MAG: SRPBCC domain-containing protein [Ignavibacteriae bacterium]|nr:MAG: SRPBCC domain-containing protein [Ignavibacteriota bacterium]
MAGPKNSPITKPKRTEIVITRIFNVPNALLWNAWTDPATLKRWWGPRDYTTPTCTLDFHKGGAYLFCMRSLEGHEFWSTGIYKEIIPFKKIVCTDNFADRDGNIIPASELGFPGEWPENLLVTVLFEDLGAQTKVTVKHCGLPEGEMGDLTEVGWNESFDKLAESLK